MKKSLWLTFLLVVVLVVSALAMTGCKNVTEEQDQPEITEEVTNQPAEEIMEDIPVYCQGYFERMTQDIYQSILVFHTDGTFYLSKLNEGAFSAGYWELVDGEKEYATENDGELAVASQYFVLTHFDGTVEEVAYADDMLWGIQLIGFKSNMTHMPDKEWNVEDETAVTVVEFQLEGDNYSTLQLAHNGTYEDTLSAYVEGTWTVDGNTYTLVPDGESEACMLVVAEDGMSAVYTALDGTEMNLIVPAPEGPVALMTMDGASMTLELYDDGTCAILYGDNVAVEGTYAFADYALSLTLDGVDVPVAMDADTHAFSFDYILGSGEQSLSDTLVVGADVWGPLMDQLTAASQADPVILFSYTGVNNSAIVCDIYDDGTCQLVYTGMGTVAEGTWTYENYSMSITLDGEEMEVVMDETYAFCFDINMSDGQLQDTLCASSEIWGQALEGDQ